MVRKSKDWLPFDAKRPNSNLSFDNFHPTKIDCCLKVLNLA